VENGAKGFTIGRAEHKMGQHASATNELLFEDCRIPKTALMGKVNDGFRTAVGELAGGRIGIGSLGLGIGQAAIEYATKYAMNRIQFDQPITNFQAIQWMIAESYTELEAARLLLMNAAFKKENGKFFAREASMAKYYATEAAERACHKAIQWMIAESYTELEAARLLLMNAAYQKENGRFFARQASMAKYYATEAAERACYNALQIMGGYGYTREFPIERFARDVRITSIYEGTNQIQRVIIARDILSSLK